MDIAKALKLYDQHNHPVGETLSDSVRVYRIRVLTAMLKSGVPILMSFGLIKNGHPFLVSFLKPGG